MTFEEIFGKSVFIEHLTEKQQEELFSILKEKCLVKEKVIKAVKNSISNRVILNAIFEELGLE